jgi:hypothetical protein
MYTPETITLDDLMGALAASRATLSMPVRILATGDEPWLMTVAGARVVDGTLVLVAAEDDRPADADELAARADVVGAR